MKEGAHLRHSHACACHCDRPWVLGTPLGKSYDAEGVAFCISVHTLLEGSGYRRTGSLYPVTK
jgi:hypothetical protein